jgi:hypothetical protein
VKTVMRSSTKRRWTCAEVNRLRREAASGLSAREIAEQFSHRTFHAVRIKAIKSGIRLETPRTKIGRPRGVTIIKRSSIALTSEQYLELNNLAVFEGTTMAAIVRRAITQEIRRCKFIAHELRRNL